jgi:hypothetical protein
MWLRRSRPRPELPLISLSCEILMLCTTDRGATAADLMPNGTGLLIPRLDGVPVEHRFRAGDRAAIRLVQALVELNIANPSDWERVHRDPTDYLRATLNRWIDRHGARTIRRRFCLSLMLSGVLDEYFDAGEADPDGRRLYLILHPTSAAYLVARPTLDLLEREHPRLPVSFYQVFTRALSKWVRVYDYRDAEDHVEMLREWAEGEEEQYEIADVAASTPACMKQKPLSSGSLRQIGKRVKENKARAIIKATLELERVSERAKRPLLTDDVGEQFADSNPPLPSVLVVFSETDAIEAHFDDESQNMTEASPEPNLIIPLNAFDHTTVKMAFTTVAAACKTLEAATRLIDLMPGNEEYETHQDIRKDEFTPRTMDQHRYLLCDFPSDLCLNLACPSPKTRIELTSLLASINRWPFKISSLRNPLTAILDIR